MEIMYDGVVLPYCQTTRFNQVAVLDKDTDWFREDYDIGVTTIFTADYLLLILPEMVNRTDNAAHIMAAVRAKLLRPRRQFQVKCDGVNLIPVIPDAKGTVDIKNGPIPQYCNIIQANDSTFIVEWGVKASYWERNSTTIVGENFGTRNMQGNPVLVNRWTETQDINDCLYTTRTREGVYIIRSDNSAGLIVDKFREKMAVLGVPPGFLRQSSSYTVSPDGLSLSYRIVDVEQYKMPPFPAYTASGKYTEQTLRFGAQRWGEVRLTLKGSKISDQGRLVLAAIGIATAKVRANGVKLINNVNGKPRFAIMEYCNLTVDLYENIVDIVMRSRMLQARVFTKDQVNPNSARYWGWEVGHLTWTPTTTNDQGQPLNLKWPIGGTTTGINDRMLLQAAAYYDPSLRDTVINKETGNFTNNLLEVGQAGQKKER